MTKDPANTADYEVGYKKTPIHTRFKPRCSGNPTGQRKNKQPNTLAEAITATLNQPVRSSVKQRGRITRRDLMIRRLVERAINGERSALVDLIRVREEAGPRRKPDWEKISFAEGVKRKGWDKLSDEFFANQDKEKAEYRKERRSRSVTLADLIDRELARRVRATRGGRSVRVSVQEVIATRYANEATEGDGSLIKFLQKLVPEKSRGIRITRLEIERPNAAEVAARAAELAEDARLLQEYDDEAEANRKLQRQRRGLPAPPTR